MFVISMKMASFMSKIRISCDIIIYHDITILINKNQIIISMHVYSCPCLIPSIKIGSRLISDS